MNLGKISALCIALSAVALVGCHVSENSGTKVANVSYEIIKESEIPEELHEQIEEKKSSEFKLSYEDGESLYIARGYGEKATGGYSIRIKDCYYTTNALLFDTELIGPRKGEQTVASPSYPYIVIRTEASGENVIFD